MKNLLKNFNKIWDKKEEIDNLSNILIEKLSKNEEIKNINEKDYSGYIDDANVLMIIPKKAWLKKLIENNFKVKAEKERTIKLFNSLNYIPDKFEEASCSYTQEYMGIIFGLAKSYDKIRLKLKKDKPLFAELDDMVIILAPRSDEEEK